MESIDSLKSKKKIIRTEGYWIETEDGKLLDIQCGNTAFIFGYSNQEIKKSMNNLQDRVAFIKDLSNETCKETEELTKKLLTIGGYKGLAWAVSGSDGIEAAIHTNDQYWRAREEHKPTVLVFNPGYHGTTYLTRIFRNDYNPGDRAVIIDAPEWYNINDREQAEKICLESIDHALVNNPNIGAVMIESIPWIGGIRPWSKPFWKTLRNMCDHFDVNFIVDDIFGGVGKLGFVFSGTRYDIRPDIVAIGKSLTGGYSPLSAVCVNEKIYDLAKDGFNYSHTWSPNMAGIGAALAVLDQFDPARVALIEKHNIELLDKLMSQGLIKNPVHEGLIVQFDMIKNYDPNFLIKHGINGSIKGENSVFMCIPYIADTNYYQELETRLSSALNDPI